MLSMWVKISLKDILKYFSNFPRNQILIFHANCLLKDNLYEMSKPIFQVK